MTSPDPAPFAAAAAAARPRRPRRRAFTLVELMISIALALMLIYGISQVFKLSGDTVGANQAVSTMTRDFRAAQATLVEDFRNSLADSPLFLISNRIAYGYRGPGTGYKAGWRNAEEERDESVGADPLSPTTINGSTVPAPSITGGTDRTPRIDRLAFFVRNLYRRQTAASAQVSSGVTSTEAYIWYGHAALPTADPATWLQPHDQYAVDRVLARTAILMRNSKTTYADRNEDYLMWPSSQRPADPNFLSSRLWPLGWSAPVTNPNSLRTPRNAAAAYQSTKDLAPVSLDEWREYAARAYDVPNTGFYSWFRPMLDPDPAAGQFWRAWVRPTVTRPIDQVKMAQTAPYFVGHCTQFIVEYAGDYLNQSETDDQVPGIPTDVAVKMNPKTGDKVYGTTDGVIDYVIDTSADGVFNNTTNQFTPSDPPSQPAKWVRRTRWYGLPRDVTGDGRITINDVVPLSDVLAYYEIRMGAKAGDPGYDTRAIAPWEIDLPNMTDPADEKFSTKQGIVALNLRNARLPAHPRNTNEAERKHAQQDYAMIDRDPATGQANPARSRMVAPSFVYTAAFHNEAPPMIRITMKIEDPSGKLRDGQWYQFVLTR